MMEIIKLRACLPLMGGLDSVMRNSLNKSKIDWPMVDSFSGFYCIWIKVVVSYRGVWW